MARMLPNKFPRASTPASDRRHRNRALFFEPLESRRLLATFVVNDPGDQGELVIDGVCGTVALPVGLPCTLRAALDEANATAGKDTIIFNIQSGPQTILTSGLEAQFPVDIDGTTQPGFSGAPIIELSAAAGTGNDGLVISGGNSLVKGLVINRFALTGLTLASDGNQVVGNYIGTDLAGTSAAGNGFGIQVVGNDNVIGGPNQGDGNVVSGNLNLGANALGDGIVIFGKDRNVVQGNHVGLTAAGDPLGNDGYGVLVDGGTLNQIGGETRAIDDDDGNSIGANKKHGVFLRDSSKNVVSGNLIRDNQDSGIFVLGGKENAIGGVKGKIGELFGERNVITGNGQTGVTLAGTSDNRVLNNRIGIQLLDNVAPNDVGVQIGGVNLADSATNNVIDNNVISGNTQAGVRISGTGTTGNSLFGNWIGINLLGTEAKPNGGDGVLIDTGASKNQIGPAPLAPKAGIRNIISGNAGAGVRIMDGADRNRISSNTIGADMLGQAAIPNQQGGVRIEEAARNFVSLNVISGNNLDGVLISGQAAQRNVIEGNQIGTRSDGGPLGNARSGVRFADQADGNHVGPASGAAANDVNPLTGRINVIAHNGGQGVVAEPQAGNRNHVLGPTSIFSNTGLGIDLGEDGVTLNDGLDSDVGPNRLQNFPVLTAYTPAGGKNILSGTINTAPGRKLTIDAYANRACDPSGFGEGETYLNSVTVTTDANGNASFDIPVNPPGVFSALTATARTPTGPGDTSEFSSCLTIPPPVASAIQGRKFEDLDGDGEQDAEEPGRGGWTIELVDPGSGSVIDTTVTLGVDEVCPPGPHFVAHCPTGEDTFDSVSLIELDLDLDNQADERIFLTGPTRILRGDAIDAILGDPLLGDAGQLDSAFDVIPTELVSLTLTGDGISLTGGDGGADLTNTTASHSPGVIVELPEDPTQAAGRFEVFFEVETTAGLLHNVDPLPLSTIIDRVYPQGTAPLKFRDNLAAPLSLFDASGVERARLLSLVHTRNEPGFYLFAGLDAGTYLVREQPVAGWEQVFPDPTEYLVTLPPDTIVGGRDFGNTPLDTADLVVNKSSSPPVVGLGGNIEQLIVATNLGPHAATGVVVTDQLPAATTFDSASTTHGTCSHANGVVTCDVGDLTPLDAATIRINTTANAAGETTNSAAASAAEFDPRPANNSAQATTIISDFLFTAPTGNGRDELILRRNGDDLEIVDAVSGLTLASQPLANSTTVAIIGADHEDDHLVVDFSGGDLSLGGGLYFFGGAGGDDSLALDGGSFDKVNYRLDNAHDGAIDLTNGDSLTITYTGLEPIVDNLDVVDRSFAFEGGTEDITIADEAAPGDGLMRIDSTASESVVFQVPSATLLIRAGSGDDDVELLSSDSLLTIPVTVQANAASNYLDLKLATTDLTLISEGGFIDVLLAGSGNDLLTIDGDDFAQLDGGAGSDILRLTGSEIHLDLPLLPDGVVAGFEEIDIVGNSPNSLTLNQDEVLNLSAETDTLLIRHDEDDSVDYGPGWTVEPPQFIAGVFLHRLTQGSAEVRVANTRPWQNPFNHLDANRDGILSAQGDVLVTINTINRDDPRELLPPTSPDVPPFYYDANGDRFVTSNDVLVMINAINAPSGEAEGESPWIPAPFSDRRHGGANVTLPAAVELPPPSVDLAFADGAPNDRWVLDDEPPPGERYRRQFPVRQSWQDDLRQLETNETDSDDFWELLPG